MNDQTTIISNNTNASWDGHHDNSSLPTRIGFASAWIFIAVVGIIGKEKNLLFFSKYIHF